MSARKRDKRDHMLAEVGLAGRRTGIRVDDTGTVDELGMESLDRFFSSVPSASRTRSEGIKTLSGEESMQVDHSRIVTHHTPGTHPRWRSPVKTNFKSPALRMSSAGPASDSRRLEATPKTGSAKKSVSKSPDVRKLSSPIGIESRAPRVSPAVARRLDFTEMVEQDADGHREVFVDESMKEYVASPSPKKRGLLQPLQSHASRSTPQKAASSSPKGKSKSTEKRSYSPAQLNRDADDLEMLDAGGMPSPSPSSTPPSSPKHATTSGYKRTSSGHRKNLNRVVESESPVSKPQTSTSRSPLQQKPHARNQSKPKNEKSAKKLSRERKASSAKLTSKAKRTTKAPSLADDSASVDADGIRRSHRTRFKPLDYWRGEKVVYSLDEDHGEPLPHIKEIVHVPSPSPPPPRAKSRSRSRSTSVQPVNDLWRKQKFRPREAVLEEEDEGPQIEELEPEDEELDEDFEEQEIVEGLTMQYEAASEDKQTVIAFSSGAVRPKSVVNGGFSFSGIFKDNDFAASGIMELGPQQVKPPKPTRHNVMFFYVIEGAIEASVHRTTFALRKGGHFQVPRGNSYEITCVSKKPARLLYMQATDTAYNESLLPSSDIMEQEENAEEESEEEEDGHT